MSPDKTLSRNSLRLTAVALIAAFVTGCSLNPFADDDPEPAMTPAEAQGDAAQPSPRSLYSESPTQTPQQPAATPQAQLVSRQVPLAAGAPEEYVVKEGDTLWDIASTFLSDPWYWPEVWYVNPQIENPHLIYPGDVLALVTIDGSERITTVRGSSYRLSPQARITPLEESIRAIAFEDIASFLKGGAVLEKGEAETLPYILASREDHIIAAAGNDVYVRGGSADPTGTPYSVVHVDDELVDPDDGNTVGYQAIYIGRGVLSRGGDPATVTLTDSNREVLLGDRLLPEISDIPLNFYPKAPDTNIDGRIISVVDGVSLIGQYQVVVINRGARDGLVEGDVLDVLQTGAVIKDRFAGGTLSAGIGGENVKLPDEQAGTIMVFRVYDRIGYGLVMEATSAIRVLDTVRNPG